MTFTMSVRFKDETARQLDDLAQAGHTSKVSALEEAVQLAWRELQYQRLEEGYATIAAEDPLTRSSLPRTRPIAGSAARTGTGGGAGRDRAAGTGLPL